MSYQKSLSSKTVVMNIFIFNVSTDFSGINSALEKLIYCSDNFSSYELWHVNKCSSENSGSAYLHNAVYLTKATFSSYSMKDHPSVVTGLGAGRVEGVLLEGYLLLLIKHFLKILYFLNLQAIYTLSVPCVWISTQNIFQVCHLHFLESTSTVCKAHHDSLKCLFLVP